MPKKHWFVCAGCGRDEHLTEDEWTRMERQCVRCAEATRTKEERRRLAIVRQGMLGRN